MNKTILLADDDASVRHMLGRVLNAEQYAVISARTGREAANAFLSRAPDLVLLDLNLPEKDGWEAFHFMRQLNPWSPIIIITGTPNQFTHALRMAANALMEKPLNLPVLLDEIRTLLGETDGERMHRLTRPDFKTTLLHTAQPLKEPLDEHKEQIPTRPDHSRKTSIARG